MKIDEILTEQEMIEAGNWKKWAAAGAVGAGLALSPNLANTANAPPPSVSTVQQEPVQQKPVQQVKPEVEPEQDEIPNFAEMSIPDKKRAFIDFMLPLARRANQEVLEARKQIISLKDEQRLSPRHKNWLSSIFKQYNVDQGDYEELLKRVDTVPVSQILAQAIIESGWGTSRFFKQGNAVFGQRDYTGKGMVPKGRSAGETFTVASFDSHLDSVKNLVYNLNVSFAYQDYRNSRANLRSTTRTPSGIELANGLIRYSERGQAYIRDVVGIIKSNNLSRFDQI